MGRRGAYRSVSVCDAMRVSKSLKGLVAGDQVVTAGMRLSRDGQPVRILQPGAAPGTRSKKDVTQKR